MTIRCISINALLVIIWLAYKKKCDENGNGLQFQSVLTCNNSQILILRCGYSKWAKLSDRFLCLSLGNWKEYYPVSALRRRYIRRGDVEGAEGTWRGRNNVIAEDGCWDFIQYCISGIHEWSRGHGISKPVSTARPDSGNKGNSTLLFVRTSSMEMKSHMFPSKVMFSGWPPGSGSELG